jgi:hypothetical protein
MYIFQKTLDSLLQTILISIFLALVIYAAPIIASPLLVMLLISKHGLLEAFFDGHLTELYGAIYYWCFYVLIGSCGVFFLHSFIKTNKHELEYLYNSHRTLQGADSARCLWKLAMSCYLWHNREIVKQYATYKNLHPEIKSNYPEFKDYLRCMKSPYLRWYEEVGARRTWYSGLEDVASHYRRGHYRTTKHGTVYVSSHEVQAHSRRRNK